MKDHTHRLLAVLKDENASVEFKETSRDLLHASLLPGWRRLPDREPGTNIPLTIGMATMDDYDGVYFSLQALQLYHSEILEQIEIVVIDNNPDGKSGQAVASLLEKIPRSTYIPFTIRSGTAVRDALFRFARGRFVLCMDCHVFFPSGSLSRLLEFIQKHPDCSDLLQGPLLDDNLQTVSSHLKDEWNSCFWGCWDNDERANDIDNEPFEIFMQGLGVFCSRREAWPGFNPRTKGFGGEEGSLHELYRKRGNKTLCLPFLRWLHRFERPLGVPYSNKLEQRVRNYLILFQDAGLDQEPVLAHFRTKMSEEALTKVVEDFECEKKHPSYRFEMLFALTEGHPEVAATSFQSHDLFARSVVRPIGQTQRYDGLPLFVALRECCREALLLELEDWCVFWIGEMSKEQIVARLEFIEYLDWQKLWAEGPRAKLGPKFELWRFDSASAKLFLSSTPENFPDMVEESWYLQKCSKLETHLEATASL